MRQRAVIDQVIVLMLVLAGAACWQNYRFDLSHKFEAAFGVFICFGAAVIIEAVWWFSV